MRNQKCQDILLGSYKQKIKLKLCDILFAALTCDWVNVSKCTALKTGACLPVIISGTLVLLPFAFMVTSSNGNMFRITGLCAGNSPVTGEFPTQRPVTRSFEVFFDMRMSKQLRRCWYETLSCSVWRHCNVQMTAAQKKSTGARSSTESQWLDWMIGCRFSNPGSSR